MNANDAMQLKNKFDTLMKTAEDFGNESIQLSKARKSLNEMAGNFKSFSTQITKLVSCCQEYLNTVDNLVSDGFTQQIGQDISKVSGLVRQYQQQSGNLTKQYKANLALFEENLGKIAKLQNTIIYEVEKTTEANAATIESALQQLEVYKAEIKEVLQKSAEAQQTAAAEEVARLLDVLSALANIQSAQISFGDVVSQVQVASKNIDNRLQNDSTQIIASLNSIEQNLDKYTAETNNMIKCSLDEKTVYLKTQFQNSAHEILGAAAIISEKTDALSNSNNKIIEALGNIEQNLDRYAAEMDNLVKCSLDEKTIYLEKQFQTFTHAILDMTTVINEKADSISNSNSQIQDLLLGLASEYTDQTNQLANRYKVMLKYWAAGFGILFVLSILGFFI